MKFSKTTATVLLFGIVLNLSFSCNASGYDYDEIVSPEKEMASTTAIAIPPTISLPTTSRIPTPSKTLTQACRKEWTIPINIGSSMLLEKNEAPTIPAWT